MRQKKLKYVNEELLRNDGVITVVQKIELGQHDVFLEIGSGKGLFITTLAADNPNRTYIAMEMNINVCYRILEKKKKLGLKNLIIIFGDAKDLLTYISPKSLCGIYLNFPDPWPKKKHHKRRLTASSFLQNYLIVVKKNGFIQFRTDHIHLFDDSIGYFHSCLNIESIEYDLAKSTYITEYEIKKRALGPIYQLIGKVD